jgi:hypothetical protein
MVRSDQYSSFPPFMLTLCIFKLGGRQVDGAIPSLLALEMIMKSPKIKAAQQSEKLTILFDSGIRTGSDIIKALALGAQAVLCKFSQMHLISPIYITQFSGSSLVVWFDRWRPGWC